MPYSSVVRYHCFRGLCHLHIQGENGGKTLVSCYITTQHLNAEEGNFNLHWCENLKLDNTDAGFFNVYILTT